VKESGITPTLEVMLSKLLAPKTYQEHPEIINQARGVMQGATLDGIIGVLAGMRDREDFTQFTDQIDVPVLIFHGIEDQLIPRIEAESMAESIAGSQLILIPNAGHLLNLEQPEIFNQGIRNFLHNKFMT
jgi:pimeloyl-ACP methyl ester carboxylesterase